MAYQNPKPYGWCPRNDYQVHEVTKPALPKRFDRPQHQKGHVTFKTNNEEPTAEVKVEASSPVAETKTTVVKHNRQRDHNDFESVDQDADVFINQEHRRIELARLKSMGVA